MYLKIKNIGVCVALFALSVTLVNAYGQSTNQNFIRTITPSVEIKTEAALAAAAGNANQVQISIDYFDGLGRPSQSVQVKGNKDGSKDILQPFEYDQFGREVKKYLPFAYTGTPNGTFRTDAIAKQALFYKPVGSSGTQQSNGVVITEYPYAMTVLEASPLNRVNEQGFPGAVWQPGTRAMTPTPTGRTVITEYVTNTGNGGNYKARLYRALNPGSNHTRRISNDTLYAANELSVTIIKDENWPGGTTKAGTIEEYKDKQDRLLLKRIWNTETEAYSTYYVYDDLGNLSFVLPPGVNPDNTTQLTQAQLDGFCYQYRYDKEKRLIEKKIPGKGWEYLIYNERDQVIATQDSVQRMKSPQQASFTKYDAFGRIIIAGTFTITGAVGSNQRTNIQDVAGTLPTWENRLNLNTGNDYSNNSYPTTNFTILQINYYDSYDNIPGRPATGMPSNKSDKLKGLLTASKTYILNNQNQFLWEVPYYNEEGRIIATYKQHYKGATSTVRNYDLISTTYNKVTGQVTTNQRKHYVVNSANNGSDLILTVYNKYLYDHMGRKIKTWQQMTNAGLNADGSVLLSRQEYNEIGQLWNKYLHTTDTVNNNFKQKITQLYNTRGWLSQINDPDAVTATSVFGTKLFYDEGTSKYFNGNIGGLSWQTKVPANPTGLYQAKQTYTYTYDNINRLTKARYNTVADKFNEELTYDKMSNILSLIRRNGPTTVTPLNNFTYNYTTGVAGNKLWSVNDIGTANQDATYTYDGNGSVITDTRNQITSITYNILNLPQTIVRAAGNITYFYDAGGQKLRKSVVGGAVRDYIDGLEYGSTGVDFISTEEGRVRPTTGTDFVYEYFLKDHLGNIRAAIMENGDIVQVQDYYAFGLEMNPGNGFTPTPDNKYKYNGKEKQDETGQLDYGARFYDPVIARWSVADALADENEQIDKSPYAYAWNNPINLTDPDGNCPKCGEFIKGVGRGVASGFGRTVDFVKRDAWKVETWKNTGNLALGMMAMGVSPTGRTNLASIDAALGTNTSGAISGFETSIASTVDKVKNGNAGQRGEVLGEVIYGVAEAFVGSKGAGLAAKGFKGVRAAEAVGEVTEVAQKSNNFFTVTQEGVVLPKGTEIPKSLIENPYKKSSYGVMNDGKFSERLRIDPATPVNKKGPGTSHFHVDGNKQHIFDISKWPGN